MENRQQAEVLIQIPGDMLDNIDKYGAEFREVIDGFLRERGIPPTAEEIKWCVSQHHGRDITEG